MAPKSSQAIRRAAKAKAKAADARSFVVDAYAALSGNYLTTVQTSRDETVQVILGKICEASGRDAEETALLLNGGRLDTASTVGNTPLGEALADATVQVMAVPRPIKSFNDLLRVFNRNNTDGELAPPRVSFDITWDERMEGEFVARMNGDPDATPPGTVELQVYKPDGSLFGATVSKRLCATQQWVLDGRPVFFKVKSFGTYSWRVNPVNGHSATCACANCVGAEQRRE